MFIVVSNDDRIPLDLIGIKIEKWSFEEFYTNATSDDGLEIDEGLYFDVSILSEEIYEALEDYAAEGRIIYYRFEDVAMPSFHINTEVKVYSVIEESNVEEDTKPEVILHKNTIEEIAPMPEVEDDNLEDDSSSISIDPTKASVQAPTNPVQTPVNPIQAPINPVQAPVNPVQMPQYQQPQYQQPSYQPAPQYQQPQYQQPSYQPTPYQQPSYPQPQYQQPSYQPTQPSQSQYQTPQHQPQQSQYEPDKQYNDSETQVQSYKQPESQAKNNYEPVKEKSESKTTTDNKPTTNKNVEKSTTSDYPTNRPMDSIRRLNLNNLIQNDEFDADVVKRRKKKAPAKVILFGSSKGGTGKTFTCLISAYWYAKKHPTQKVALADFDIIDGQIGITINKLAPTMQDFYKLSKNGYTAFGYLENCKVKTEHFSPNIDFYLAPPQDIPQITNDTPFWNNLFETLISNYDVVFFDSGIDYLGKAPVSQLYKIADKIIITSNPSINSTKSVLKQFKTLSGRRPNNVFKASDDILSRTNVVLTRMYDEGPINDIVINNIEIFAPVIAKFGNIDSIISEVQWYQHWYLIDQHPEIYNELEKIIEIADEEED